jgi:hypothetical protein
MIIHLNGYVHLSTKGTLVLVWVPFSEIHIFIHLYNSFLNVSSTERLSSVQVWDSSMWWCWEIDKTSQIQRWPDTVLHVFDYALLL